MLVKTDLVPIGELARRSGVAASALRFYEAEGLITAQRDQGGRRRFPRSTLRRVAFIQAGQRVGLSLQEVRHALSVLPENRTPNRSDWAALSRGWRARLDDRIRELQRLRDELTGCIGCGCLSLTRCRLYNPDDAAARLGAGAHYLRDENASEVVRQGLDTSRPQNKRSGNVNMPRRLVEFRRTTRLASVAVPHNEQKNQRQDEPDAAEN
jgi:MerR family transcriptional regulator, redox-sensitive transcriptional activator SoxR